ncbi:MAG: UMP kinase [Verrucomicrobia bacterium]|nr:UMP kinase [Verrucomicrobiota bacterium]
MASDGKPEIKYKRILLKLSGEVFRNKEKGLSIDPEILADIGTRVRCVKELGVEIALVVGGGNIFRGTSGALGGIDRTSGDYMGMLATIINGLALQSALEKAGLATRVLTSLEMQQVAEPFILRRALRHFEKDRVLIFAGGTGNPYFSTDTAAALRASEIGADALLKATKVDGVYSSDPFKDPAAVKYDRISYAEALEKSLKVMDGAAFALCRENKIPIVVFNFFQPNSIRDVVLGKNIGTLVSE